MAATLIINRKNGAGETDTNIKTARTRGSRADTASILLSDPITIPESAAAAIRGFWIITRAEITVAAVNNITKIEWYTDGVDTFLVDVGGVAASLTVKVATSDVYDTPSTDELTVANYGNGTDDLDGAPADIFTYVTGARLSVFSGLKSGTGEVGKYVIMQVTSVNDSVEPTLVNPETITWAFEES